MIRHIFGMQSIKLEPPPKKKIKEMMRWGFCSSLGLTSTMKVNELKLYIYIFKKKRKKMENLWKRFFLIEEEEYTVVSNDRMIKKTSRRIRHSVGENEKLYRK